MHQQTQEFITHMENQCGKGNIAVDKAENGWTAVTDVSCMWNFTTWIGIRKDGRVAIINQEDDIWPEDMTPDEVPLVYTFANVTTFIFETKVES